jgi:hypothetical protein
MQYQKKKYIKHKLDLNQIIINSPFLTIAQLRSTNIYQWISIKQELLKYNVKIKLCSVNLLKKYGILHLNENGLVSTNNFNYDCNLYHGNVVLLYSNTPSPEQLPQLVKVIANTEFFVPLSIYFQKRLQSIGQFKRLLTLKLEKTEEVMPLLLQNNNPFSLLQLDMELLSLLTKMSTIKNEKI